MELQDLRYFMAVAQHLNFTRAAESLHVTQPTLSRRIRDLEVELGAQLFNRDYHSISLTGKGMVLQREAYGILQKADAISTLLGGADFRADSALSGVLRIGHQAGIDYSLASKAVEVLSAQHPNLRLFVSRHDLGELRDELRQGAIDVAILLISESDQHRGMEAYRIGKSRIVVIAPDGHPFAERTSIGITELAGQDIVMLDREVSPQTVDFVTGRCFANGFSLHGTEYVQSAENVFMRVAAGKGIAFAHSNAILLDSVEELGIHVIEIDDEDMSFDVAVARREDDESPAVSAYLDTIRALAKDQTGI